VKLLKLGFGGVVLVGGTVVLLRENDPMGWISLVFFGGGLLMLAGSALARRRPAPAPRRGTLPGAARFSTDTEGTLYAASRPGVALSAFGALIFVVVGLAFLAAPVAHLGFLLVAPLGLLCLAVFGPMLVECLVALVRPAGVLLLPDGAYLRLPVASAWIPWASLNKPHKAGGAMGGLAVTIRRGGDGKVLGCARFLRPVQRWYGADAQVNGLILPQAGELVQVLDAARHDPDPAAYVESLRA
jgi:hypothetical protein